MKLVCIREGRMDTHVGDVFEVPDPPEGEEVRFDLTFFSHYDSEASQNALASVKKDDEKPKPDSAPAENEDRSAAKPEASGTPVLGDDDAMNEGAK